VRARARARARASSIIRYRRDSIPPLRVRIPAGTRVSTLRGITPAEDAFLFLLSLKRGDENPRACAKRIRAQRRKPDFRFSGRRVLRRVTSLGRISDSILLETPRPCVATLCRRLRTSERRRDRSANEADKGACDALPRCSGPFVRAIDAPPSRRPPA